MKSKIRADCAGRELVSNYKRVTQVENINDIHLIFTFHIVKKNQNTTIVFENSFSVENVFS